jgi:hypothetical protein
LAIDTVVILGQGEFLDKDAYSHVSGSGLWSFITAAADADKRHSSLPRQNNGGSDALCLGTPPVHRLCHYSHLAKPKEKKGKLPAPAER